MTTLLLCACGIYFVFDVSTHRANPFSETGKQFINLLIGMVVMWLVSRVDPQVYTSGKVPWFFYLASLGLMILCFVPINTSFFVGRDETMGAYRWFRLFGYSVQVAELVKFGMIVFFSFLFSRTTDWRVLLTFLILPVLLMLAQKDLGSLLVVGASVLALYVLAGASWRHLAVLIAGGLLTVVLLIAFGDSFRMNRVKNWLDPEGDCKGSGQQICQMLIAIGRGGLWGQGLAASRQKYGKVPVVNSDSIFSIIAEETGFLGVSFLLALMGVFLLSIWQLLATTPLAPITRLMAYGIYASFLAQIFINIASISSVTPLTGITLPFISNGGSSLIVSLGLVGVLWATAERSSSEPPASPTRAATPLPIARGSRLSGKKNKRWQRQLHYQGSRWRSR